MQPAAHKGLERDVVPLTLRYNQSQAMAPFADRQPVLPQAFEIGPQTAAGNKRPKIATPMAAPGYVRPVALDPKDFI